MSRVAVIGAGNMGGAIARRLAGSGAHVTVTAAHTDTLDRIKAECQALHTTVDNVEAVATADTVILAVKPWLVPTVMGQIAPAMAAGTTLISVAAGITLADLATMTDRHDLRLYRAIPNTPVAIGRGTTFVCATDPADSATADVIRLFEPLGNVHIIDEAHLDAAMAVTSCGVAYVLRYMRATMEGAIQLGLTAADARRWTAETLAGTAAMMLETDQHPEAAIDRVTTPGGLTIRGLNAMEANGFSTAVIQGLLASIPQR